MLVLIVGCSSSFNSCERSCRWQFRHDFDYETDCSLNSLAGIINNTPDEIVNCTKIDYTQLNRWCFNECKNTN